MMVLPEHYSKYYARFVRFAIVMIFVALIAGILFQESSKKAPFSATLPAGMHWEAITQLALVHGHMFVLGVLLPLAVVVMLQIGLILNGEPVSEKALKWGSGLFLPGAAISLALMLYKGYHYLIYVRMGQLDFATIEQAYFGGMVGLRHGLYGLSHTAMAFGIGILAVSIWRAIGIRKA